MITNGKTGRLTFSGRSDYIVAPVIGQLGETTDGKILAGTIGYTAACHCALGDHYLAYDAATRTVSEQTSNGGAVPDVCIFPTRGDAYAAIEAWQRQKEQEG